MKPVLLKLLCENDNTPFLLLHSLHILTAFCILATDPLRYFFLCQIDKYIDIVWKKEKYNKIIWGKRGYVWRIGWFYVEQSDGKKKFSTAVRNAFEIIF